MSTSLILTVTRACNLRCAYCPTVKSGWPSLSIDDALKALDLFVSLYGGGTIKLFGGEPLLEPEVVIRVLDAAAAMPEITRIYLSTNGLGLNQDWIARIAEHPKLVLTISMDGKPEDHRRFRKALPGVPDAYEHIVSMADRLAPLPRVVITQTIPPSTAAHAAANLQHLIDLGFWRFNLLPGYYIPWSDRALASLQTSFCDIGDLITARWKRHERFYLRNLFTLQPTPFFNAGFIVDCDGSIHPSNLGLSGSLEKLLSQTRVGTLADPPTRDALQERALSVNTLLETSLPPRVWHSTLAVDAELTRLCKRLYRPYLADRARRRGEEAA